MQLQLQLQCCAAVLLYSTCTCAALLALRLLWRSALSTRIVPELHFKLDLGFEYAQQINKLLDEIKREDDVP